MTVNVSIPKVLHTAAPIFRYGGIVLLILYVFIGGISGLLSGLITALLCWIISLLCDAVVELYAEIEKLHTTPTSSEHNVP